MSDRIEHITNDDYEFFELIFDEYEELEFFIKQDIVKEIEANRDIFLKDFENNP